MPGAVRFFIFFVWKEGGITFLEYAILPLFSGGINSVYG
jgi:hypothetical protein